MAMPLEPRPSAGRSLIRPPVALYLSAAALVAALAIGVVLIQSLRRAADAARRGGQTSATLQQYNAALEVWREMQAGRDPLLRRPQVDELRDSIRAALTVQFREYRAELPAGKDQALVNAVLDGLRSVEVGLTDQARRAIIMLLARQTNLLFVAAEASQRAVHYAAVLLALTAIATGLLIVPIARGARAP